MKPLHYIISTNGLGIAVGIVGDKELAQRDIILAENIYGINHEDYLFSGLLFMRDETQFKKFLILKEYYAAWDRHWTRNRVAKTRSKANIMKFTREAIKQAKLVLSSQVERENFMQKISVRNNEYSVSAIEEQ